MTGNHFVLYSRFGNPPIRVNIGTYLDLRGRSAMIVISVSPAIQTVTKRIFRLGGF